jgi:hypothetical protein
MYPALYGPKFIARSHLEEEVESQSMALNVDLVSQHHPTREQFILYRTTPEKVFKFLFKCSGVIYSSSTRIIFSQTALFGGLFSLGNVCTSLRNRLRRCCMNVSNKVKFDKHVKILQNWKIKEEINVEIQEFEFQISKFVSLLVKNYVFFHFSQIDFISKIFYGLKIIWAYVQIF